VRIARQRRSAGATIAAAQPPCKEPPMETPQPQRYAPPTAEVADVSADGQAALAGRGVRLVAAIIDTAILLGLFWLIALATPLDIFGPAMAQAGLLAKLGVQTLSLALFAAINGWLLARNGQTVGKKLIGIRIVRSDGTPAALGRILALRYGIGYLVAALHVVLLMIYSLVDCLLIFRSNRRCLHDLIADTIVVKV
jgi:uncharacterized RDD family membrane protein YckC